MDIKKEDYQKIENVYFCGTNKTKHKDDIIYLFKEYIDSTTAICVTCGVELKAVLKKFQFYFDMYFKELILKEVKIQETNDLYEILEILGMGVKFGHYLLNDQSFKMMFNNVIEEKEMTEVKKYMKGI
jgi:hypothetical protein